MKTALICHDDDDLNRQALPRVSRGTHHPNAA